VGRAARSVVMAYRAVLAGKDAAPRGPTARIFKELRRPEGADQVAHLFRGHLGGGSARSRHGRGVVPHLGRYAFREQVRISGPGPWLFPSDENPKGHQKSLKTVWRLTLRRAKSPYFPIYDLWSTYATRLSAGGVADEWVTQLLRQGDAKVFKKYSQMKLQMRREALKKLNRKANEGDPGVDTERPN
jgi:hypothetical protein